MRTRGIAVGDTIKFTCTTRDGRHTATRKVVEIHSTLGIGVRYEGYNPFWLGTFKSDKVLSVTKAPKGGKAK